MRANYIPEDRLNRIRRRLNNRDQLILDVCCETGGRIDDVLYMRGYQISGRTIHLAESKTGKVRECDISDGLAGRLAKHMGTKSRLSYVFTGRIRPGCRHKPHRSTFWRHMVEAAKAEGWGDCNYTPHSLRKVYAVRILRETRSLEQVRRIMGHKYVTTTMLYALSDRRDELGLY